MAPGGSSAMTPEVGLRYGIEVVTLGPYADPRPVVELAVAAEEAGYEMVYGDQADMLERVRKGPPA